MKKRNGNPIFVIFMKLTFSIFLQWSVQSQSFNLVYYIHKNNYVFLPNLIILYKDLNSNIFISTIHARICLTQALCIGWPWSYATDSLKSARFPTPALLSIQIYDDGFPAGLSALLEIQTNSSPLTLCHPHQNMTKIPNKQL